MFLIVFPQVAHGRLIGLLVLPACALAGSFGLWKLALGAVEKPWGIFNVLSFGALSGLAGHSRLYRIVPGADDAETVDEGCVVTGLRPGPGAASRSLQDISPTRERQPPFLRLIDLAPFEPIPAWGEGIIKN